MPTLIIAVFSLLITVAAVISCLQTPTDEIPANLPRPLWLLLIVLIAPLGGIGWFLVNWVSRQEKDSADGTVPIPRNPLEIFKGGNANQDSPHGSQLPPDDNPDFLFSLEAQMRRQRLAQEAAEKRQEKEQRNAQAVGNNGSEAEETPEKEEPGNHGNHSESDRSPRDNRRDPE